MNFIWREKFVNKFFSEIKTKHIYINHCYKFEKYFKIIFKKYENCFCFFNTSKKIKEKNFFFKIMDFSRLK